MSQIFRIFFGLGVFCLLAVACDSAGSQSSVEKKAQSAAHADEDDHGHEEHDAHSKEDDGDHDNHEDHENDEHGHEEEGHEERVELSKEDQKAFGIGIAVAEISPLSDPFELPAEVRFNQDKIANVTPRVGGVVRELYATEGDVVAVGSVLAAIDSRELADLKADYLASVAQEKLASATFARERGLLKDGITSEAELAEARRALTEAEAARTGADAKLHAAGLEHEELEKLAEAQDGALGHYELRAPIAGTVIRRDITLGQAFVAGEDGGEPTFILADERSLWIDVAVYKSDIANVAAGMPVTLKDDHGHKIYDAKIAFVTPQLDESSRTATARIVIEDEKKMLRPGQFIAVQINREGGQPGIRVSSEAVHNVEGRPSIFVPDGDGFLARPVVTGTAAGGFVQVISGLSPGDQYVEKGAFTLKSQLEKGAFGDGHAH